MKTTIDNEGRIQLGTEIQTQLGVKPGDEVVLENRDGLWVIRPAATHFGLCWKSNVLVHNGVCVRPVDQLVGEFREERLHDLSRGSSR